MNIQCIRWLIIIINPCITGGESVHEFGEYWQHIGEPGYILDTGFDSVGKLSVRIIYNQ